MDGSNTSHQTKSRGGFLLSVDFSANGNSAAYRVNGWSDQEPGRVWAVGGTSTLRLPSVWDRTPLLLDLEMAACHRPPVIRGQILRVSVNGQCLGSAFLQGRSLLRCHLPAGILAGDGPIEVLFEHPGFTSQAMLGLTDDMRPLAVCFFAARLYSESWVETEPSLATSVGAGPLLYLQPPDEASAAQGGADAQPAPAETRQTYKFGRSGNVRPFLQEGWCKDDEASTWTSGNVAHIALPAPTGTGPHVLRMTGYPLTIPDVLPAQDITVTGHGVTLGQFSAAGPTTVVMPLPVEVVRLGDTLPISLHLPGARRQADFIAGGDSRILGFSVGRIEIETLDAPLRAAAIVRGDAAASPRPIASSAQFLDATPDMLPAVIEQAIGMGVADMLKQFESLGENCEFGIVQRKLGVEVLGLLRFGYVPLESLLVALDDDFQAALQLSEISVRVHRETQNPEYILEIPRYRFRLHTFVSPDETPESVVLEREAVKLGYLRRRFYAGLQAGRKIYLLKHEQPLVLAEAMAVFLKLNRYGQNRMIYVTAAQEGRRSGSVDLIAPGLMRAHMGVFAPSDAVDSVKPADWLRIAANAVLLDRQWPTAAPVAEMPA
jgi:hypothetical protein